MRRQRKKRNIYIDMTLSSVGALVIGISMVRLVAKLFGDLVSPAIPLMITVLTIPVITLVIGVVGWIWHEYSNFENY